MRLRYLVPALGVLAFTAPSLSAVTVGQVEITGEVSSILGIISAEKNSPKDLADVNDVNGSTVSANFDNMVELRVGATIDAVTIQTDIEFHDSSSIVLEQAYVKWQINETLAWTMGRFENWIGWESYDNSKLWRVNHSPLFNTLGGNLADGTALTITPDAPVTIGIYLVEDIYGNNAGSEAGTPGGTGARALGDLAWAADVTFTVEDIGTFGADLMYDPNEYSNGAPATGVNAGSTVALDLSAEISAFAKDKLKLAADLNYTSFDQEYASTAGTESGFAKLGFTVIANYQFDPKMSVTAQLTFINSDQKDDTATAGTDESKSNLLELAVALLTQPVNQNFGLNFELAYTDREGTSSNDIGFYVEMLGILP